MNRPLTRTMTAAAALMAASGSFLRNLPSIPARIMRGRETVAQRKERQRKDMADLIARNKNAVPYQPVWLRDALGFGKRAQRRNRHKV